MNKSKELSKLLNTPIHMRLLIFILIAVTLFSLSICLFTNIKYTPSLRGVCVIDQKRELYYLKILSPKQDITKYSSNVISIKINDDYAIGKILTSIANENNIILVCNFNPHFSVSSTILYEYNIVLQKTSLLNGIINNFISSK